MNTDEPKVKNARGFITLPIKFKSGNWEFKQVWREGLFAVYAKGQGDAVHYEAIKIAETPEYTIAGNVIEARESFPSDSDWGVSGFSCVTLADAHKRIGYMKDNKDDIILKQKEVDDNGQVITRGQYKLTYPQDKEFSVAELEILNKDIKKHNIYPAIRKLVEKNEIKETRKEQGKKGKPTTYYIKA